MVSEINKVVIVGGGTAGWITAGILAAKLNTPQQKLIDISVIESPDIPAIGVGEGSWPTMRDTLKSMGINEGEFLSQCDASFKQGSKFIGWLNGEANDAYYHPFSLPTKFHEINLAPYWYEHKSTHNFASTVCHQPALCEQNLAPKQITAPQYAFAANYGYHLDAGKFAPFIRNHCTERLGVNHISDEVTAIKSHPNGAIESVVTKRHGTVKGDLFIDCSGLHGLLIDKHFEVPFNSVKQYLFNDSALAMQVPYRDEDSPILSTTNATAQDCGWIWDIGLQSRRGVGHVFSSAHADVSRVEQNLRHYLAQSVGTKVSESLEFRQLSINPGYRRQLWVENCVAVGLSAGFVEPLEASAIALIELSAKYIASQFPQNPSHMAIIARRFNEKFEQRWHQVVEFLKLHYVLSNRRDSDYWQDACSAETQPESLKEKLQLWQHQAPYHFDSVHTEELFPAASNQFIYYGMMAETNFAMPAKQTQYAHQLFDDNQQLSRKLVAAMPSNRELLNKIRQHGLAKI